MRKRCLGTVLCRTTLTDSAVVDQLEMSRTRSSSHSRGKANCANMAATLCSSPDTVASESLACGLPTRHVCFSRSETQ